MPPHWPLLMIAAFLAGIMNSVAGGGMFLIFPSLIFAGVPTVAANATATITVFPMAFASAFGYRRELRALKDELPLWPLIGISLVGAVGGAFLLISTPESIFVALVPWLLLFATMLFIFGQPLAALVRRFTGFGIVWLLLLQFIIALYGGYFGGAAGILMLAVLSLYGALNIHTMNAVKTVLAGSLNGAAVVIFVVKGFIWWPQAVIMIVAGMIGGYCGARVGRRIDPRILRALIATVGLSLSAYFFLYKQ